MVWSASMAMSTTLDLLSSHWRACNAQTLCISVLVHGHVTLSNATLQPDLRTVSVV